MAGITGGAVQARRVVAWGDWIQSFEMFALSGVVKYVALGGLDPEFKVFALSGGITLHYAATFV